MRSLELTFEEAEELFEADPYYLGGWEPAPVTEEEAIGAIQSLLDTGVVSWPTP